MHEMSIIVSLLEQIDEIVKKNGVQKVESIEIETGELRLVIPEVMQEAFRSAKKGTVCENADLLITEVEVKVKCNKCKEEFSPKINDFLCPECHEADVKTIQGDDIILKAIIAS